jgi:glucose/arabinose dehydrogenase
VLDVNVDAQSERGLLGIAVHPNFPVTPYIYLYFTESSRSDGLNNGVANRVYRFSWNGSTLTTPGTLIAELSITPGPNHDGGVIAFGPDGKLYIVIGDLNRDGRLQNNPSGAAPDDTSVLLRLNDDGTVPSDNPFFSQCGNVAKYFAYGIRNSFGMAFDPITGKLWNTENGPNEYDEINIVEPGFNSGWRKIMGPDSRNGNGIAELFALTGAHYADPEFSWFEPIGVTAIAFPNSQLFSAVYQNSVLVGDVNNGNLYRLPLNQARDGFTLSGGLADLVAERESVRVGMNFGGITDIKLGPEGRVYVVSIGDGAVYVIEPGSGITVGTGALANGEIGLPPMIPLWISPVATRLTW